MPYASVARKRCARQPTGRASFARSGDRDSESRRPASPLLAQSCLIEDWPANARVGMQNEPCARLLRSEEHTSELQSRLHLVCRLLLEKKKGDEVAGGCLSQAA